MGRPVVHFEIGCRDRAKTADFYRALFDWNTQEMGPATMIDTASGSPVTGHITSLGHEPRHYVTVYIEVDDIPAYLAKSEALGGRTVVGPADIPTGQFAWFADPDGNVIGLFRNIAPPA